MRNGKRRSMTSTVFQCDGWTPLTRSPSLSSSSKDRTVQGALGFLRYIAVRIPSFSQFEQTKANVERSFGP